MVSRRKRVFLSVVLMVELIFLATHWNDYIFTPVRIDDVAEIQLYVGWVIFGEDDLTVDIVDRDSIKTVIQYEDYFRKIDGISRFEKATVYKILFTYKLKDGREIMRDYAIKTYLINIERLLFNIKEVRLLLQEQGVMSSPSSFFDRAVYGQRVFDVVGIRFIPIAAGRFHGN